MYVYIDDNLSTGSGINYDYVIPDLGNTKFNLVTIKLRNAFNTNGEIIEVINWSK
jgi:hypothetical protein